MKKNYKNFFISLCCLALAVFLSHPFISSAEDQPTALVPGIPSKFDDQWVLCGTEGVEIIEVKVKNSTEIKEKKCGYQSFFTSKGDIPSATQLFEWKNIIVTAYNDNKTIRFTFNHNNSGWELKKGNGYTIMVHLLDHNFTRLTIPGNRVTGNSNYIPPGCKASKWEDKVYEIQLSGNDHLKYNDIKHIVFSLRPNGGVAYRKCN